jgi:hypothetical protein
MNNSTIDKDIKEMDNCRDWVSSYKLEDKTKLDQPKDYFWLQCLVLILMSLGLIAFFGYTLWYLIKP